MNIDLQMGTATEKQKQFFAAKQRFIGYGGARGGGKSWAVQKKAEAMCLTYPGIQILIIRRTLPDLKNNHILPMMSDLNGIATYKAQDKFFIFPNGSRIWFGYCDTEADIIHYQGQQYDVIFLDEATQFSEFMFRTLSASVRGTNGFPKRMYITCNPGGVGHAWVKRLFIDRHYLPGEDPNDYIFIQALLQDNKVIMDRDPDYVKMLLALPKETRAAWLEGRWDVFEGMYFTTFHESTHCCTPFEIPAHWNRFFAADYGLDMLAGYWCAVDETGRIYVYREVYKPGLPISDAAKLISDMERGENILAHWLPPDVWGRVRVTGRELPEIMGEYGIYPTQVSNARVQGWLDLLEWLKPREDGKPGILIMAGRCPNLVESMPYMLHSKRDPNDVDTEPHQYSHAPDGLRYLVSGRPWANKAPQEIDYDEVQYEMDNQIDSFLRFGA